MFFCYAFESHNILCAYFHAFVCDFASFDSV
jgi:hypothetical protein